MTILQEFMWKLPNWKKNHKLTSLCEKLVQSQRHKVQFPTQIDPKYTLPLKPYSLSLCSSPRKKPKEHESLSNCRIAYIRFSFNCFALVGCPKCQMMFIFIGDRPEILSIVNCKLAHVHLLLHFPNASIHSFIFQLPVCNINFINQVVLNYVTTNILNPIANHIV